MIKVHVPLKKSFYLRIFLVLALMLTLIFTVVYPVHAVTVQRYYSESPANSSTTNTSWTEKVSLTFTPLGTSGTTSFVVISDCVLYTDSNKTEAKAHFIEGTTEYDLLEFKPAAATSQRSFTAHRVFTLNRGTSYTFKIEYAKTTGSGSAFIRDATLTAIELSTGATTTAEYNTEQSTGTSYVDVPSLSLNVSSAGDYVIIASADVTNDSINNNIYTRLSYYNGSTTTYWGEQIRTVKGSMVYTNYFAMRKYTLSEGTNTFKLQYKAGTGTAYIKNARITAVNLSDLADVQYIESEGDSSTSTTDYSAHKATLTTFTPSARGNYITVMVSYMNQATADKEVWANEIKYNNSSSTSIDEHCYVPANVADYVVSGHSDIFALTKTESYFQTQYKTNSGGTAHIRDASIISMRANTAESYSNSSDYDPTNTFNSGAQALYFRSYGLTPSTAYIVAYYDANADGGGHKVGSDVNPSSAASGSLSTTYTFSSIPSAAAGLWHAAVFASGSSTPSTWDAVAGTTGFIASDSFTVEASAIPEIPTVLAGIGIAALCAGIYVWMRRRRVLHNVES